jgi:hypothetical protein
MRQINIRCVIHSGPQDGLGATLLETPSPGAKITWLISLGSIQADCYEALRAARSGVLRKSV